MWISKITEDVLPCSALIKYIQEPHTKSLPVPFQPSVLCGTSVQIKYSHLGPQLSQCQMCGLGL